MAQPREDRAPLVIIPVRRGPGWKDRQKTALTWTIMDPKAGEYEDELRTWGFFPAGGMTIVELWLTEMGERDGEGGDGGGFGAEDSGTEGCGLPPGLRELLEFSGSPSAFGANCQEDAAMSLGQG